MATIFHPDLISLEFVSRPGWGPTLPPSQYVGQGQLSSLERPLSGHPVSEGSRNIHLLNLNYISVII